jgi:nucleoside recognition membrane protein YjiH
MLQRIQTLYLLIASLISGGLLFMVSLWTTINGEVIYMMGLLNELDWKLLSIPVAFLLSAILSLVSIFLFKNRKHQFVLNRINIMVNIYLLVIIVFLLLTLSGESQISEKGIGLFMPVVVIVLLALANKAIHKDEALVKSVDRLR